MAEQILDTPILDSLSIPKLSEEQENADTETTNGWTYRYNLHEKFDRIDVLQLMCYTSNIVTYTPYSSARMSSSYSICTPSRNAILL